jgi:hypothetical protein
MCYKHLSFYYYLVFKYYYSVNVGEFAFTSFRSRDLVSCDSTSPD